MAIVLARVDNRLVHGQILSAWLPALGADLIVVLDDEAARNTLVRSAMAIAIPPDVDFEVAPVSRAKETLAKIPAQAKAIVLFRDVSDVVRAVEGGAVLPRLNLGNIHFSHGRTTVSQAVYLAGDEVTQLLALEASGLPIELKTLPRDVPLPLAEVRRRVPAGLA
jgi:PTS system N-acetylgalactosamine-specific IIB component